jgi:uncharacterized protein YjdB
MKKQYFFIWMMAATMFAASCSKDGSDEKVDTQTPAEVSQDVQTKKTHPITIVAEKKSSSVSKVSLANGNSTLVFDDGDVLILMNGEDKCGELNLKNGAGKSSATFEGTINDGVTSFTAQIGNELQSFATSNVSLKALVDEYTFLKSEEVTYTMGETISISLTDQNAYFAIATNLNNTKIKIGNADEQTIDGNGIWIAVADGTSVTLFGKTVTAAKGQFYSVAKNDLLTSITLSDATATIAVSGTTTLSVSAYSPNIASNAVAWSSSNTAVASVSETGVVTGVAVGTATITATATDGSGVTQTCTVRVNDVPNGYVDFGIDNADNKQVYFEQNPSSEKFLYSAISDKNTLPSLSEWQLLINKCYWKWVDTDGKKGYYVFKAKSSNDEGKKSTKVSNPTLEGTYNENSDPCIFLPFVSISDDEQYRCAYWSSNYDDYWGEVSCLSFDELHPNADDEFPDNSQLPVCTVQRKSNN